MHSRVENKNMGLKFMQYYTLIKYAGIYYTYFYYNFIQKYRIKDPFVQG